MIGLLYFALAVLASPTHSRVANSTASKLRHGPAPMDHLGLVETVDGFGEGVIVGISDTADRRFNASLDGTDQSDWADAYFVLIDRALRDEGTSYH